MLRSVVALAAVLGLAACKETPESRPGPLGTLRLVGRKQQPTAAATQEVKWKGQVKVCEGPPFAPAVVQLEWTSLTDGREAWLKYLSAQLVTGSERLWVHAPAEVPLAASLDLDGPWVELGEVRFHCERLHYQGFKKFDQQLIDVVQVFADGQLTSGSAHLETERVP